MKITYLLPALALVAACSSPVEDKKEPVETVESTTQEPIKMPEVKVVASDLEGIWEIKEMRMDPMKKGTPPSMLNTGVLFGFSTKMKMSTTSLGLKHMRETVENSPFAYTIKDNTIISTDGNVLFTTQWGAAGIKIVMFNGDEMCLQSKTLSSKPGEFAYLKRLE